MAGSWLGASIGIAAVAVTVSTVDADDALSEFHGVSWFAFTTVVVILLGSHPAPRTPHSEQHRAEHYRSREHGGLVSTVVVAGGTDGIGRAVAEMHLQRGDRTAVSGRDLVKGAEFLVTAKMAEATDRRDHTKHWPGTARSRSTSAAETARRPTLTKPNLCHLLEAEHQHPDALGSVTGHMQGSRTRSGGDDGPVLIHLPCSDRAPPTDAARRGAP
ncbi:MAG: hypothetical protein ACRDRT_01930, partial [Pseudonocardiaceae bacterium]